jgi:hypothetical protein
VAEDIYEKLVWIKDSFLNLISNPLVAAPLIFITTIALYAFEPQLWADTIKLMFSYVLAELLRERFIKGGNGVKIVPLIGKKHEMNTEGHAMTFFFLYVVVGTSLAGLIASTFTNWFRGRFDAIMTIPVTLVIMCFVVVLYWKEYG